MKKKLLSLLLLACVALSSFAGCDALLSGLTGNSSSSQSSSPVQSGAPTVNNSSSSTEENFVAQDYAGLVKLDMTSETQKLEVTVKAYIDGDTTHFYLPAGANVPKTSEGVLKARYLAVNTPESTGKIEKWGKQASNYTKETLLAAESIMIETDKAAWEVDSTGDRHLVWIWYKPQGATEYRNLNIELLQQGLAIASNSAQNRYGEICMSAIAQAKKQSLKVYSNEKDPLFYEGAAVELDLKELRLNVADYNGIAVAFEGVITYNYSEGVYVEKYDEESDIWYGMYVYYGFGVSGQLSEILSVGNKVRIVGKVSYWETGDSYQVSGLTYSAMRPNDPANSQWVDKGTKYPPAYKETTADMLYSQVTIDVSVYDEETQETTTVKQTHDYAALGLYGSLSMKNLTVTRIYTTQSGDSKGAMTITCKTADGKTVTVRTEVLYDKNDNGALVTADRFLNKTIDVRGVIDCFNGEYQIKTFTLSDITVH